jgi:hypothetical protein
MRPTRRFVKSIVWIGVGLFLGPLGGEARAERHIAPARTQRQVRMSGAKVKFGVRCQAPIGARAQTFDGRPVAIDLAANRVAPGIIITRNKGVADPGRRTVQLDSQRLRTATSRSALVAETRRLFVANEPYLRATEVSGPDKKYIAADRQAAFFKQIKDGLPGTRLNGNELNQAKLALAILETRVVQGITHTPEIGHGVAADYHPYSSPYSGGFEVLSGLTKNGVEKNAFENLATYVTRKKTTRAGSEIKEWDIERSIGLRVALRTTKESVSPKSGTENNYNPQYVVIRLKTEGLPSELSGYAGKAVYKIGTEIYLDGTATRLPASATAHLRETPVAAKLLTLREFKPGEKKRSMMKFDWMGDGTIAETAINTGWWGHCHIEAPLAALGVEAKSRVTLFRESAGKEVTVGKTAANDLLFGLFDTSAMYDMTRRGMGKIDQTAFVGQRNDSREGGFGDYLSFKGSGRSQPFRVKIKEVYKRGNSTETESLTYAFQERIPGTDANGRPTLVDNPEFLGRDARNRDLHRIGGDRKVVAEVKYLDFRLESETAAGLTKERRQWTTIDPASQERVFVGSEINRRGTHPKVTKFYYNPRRRAIESLSWEWKRHEGRYQKVLLNGVEAGEPLPGEDFDNLSGRPRFATVRANVTGLELSREVRKESAHEITAFIGDTIRNKAGAVMETSPGGPVWNFPLTEASKHGVNVGTTESLFSQLDRAVQEVHVSVTTTGSDANATVVRRRDANGRVRGAEFRSEFIDFAWAPETYHALPSANGSSGGMLNFDAIMRGVSWGRESTQSQAKYTEAVHSLASDALYLSMVKPDAQHIYGIRRTDGSLVYYTSQQEYQTAKTQLGGNPQ